MEMRDELHRQWTEDPPSIRELMDAPIWALGLDHIERLRDAGKLGPLPRIE